MPRPDSLDLRDRVTSFMLAGATSREAAARFGVSVSAAVKWAQRLRATGSAAARPMGGVRRSALSGQRGRLLERIAEKPDLTLRAVQAELADRGVAVSSDAVWRFFLREGVTFKKKACTPPSRIGRTWRASVSDGDVTRARSTRGA